MRSGFAMVANKILSAIAIPIPVDSNESVRVTVSGSLGISMFPEDTEDENELRTTSDKAMYSAKKDKAGWRMYSELLNSLKASDTVIESNTSGDDPLPA